MSDTLTFSEKNNGWTSFFSYKTKLMAKLNNRFFTFKNGQLWIHNDENSDVRNNFYGEQFNSKIATVINAENSEDKIFKNLVYEGNKPWDATLKTNLTNGTIKAGEFNNRESRWFAHTRGNEDETSFNGGATQGVGVIQNTINNVVFFTSVSEFLNIGDQLFQLNNNTPELIGVVNEKTNTTVTVDSLANTPVNGYFAFGKKDSRVEGSEIRGYFLDVELENTDTEKVELFAIESNIIKSYV